MNCKVERSDPARVKRTVDNLDTHVSTIMDVLEDKISVLEVRSQNFYYSILC